MFLTAPVKPEDFFKNGKPCDTVAQDCIFFGKDSAGPYNGANVTVVNEHFNKKRSILGKPAVWFNPKNGIRNIIRTTLLMPRGWFPGFYYQHVASSFFKSTFEEVWEKEFEILDETCSHRFRKNGDVNQWVFKYWQIAKGDVSVRSWRFSECYHVKEDNFEDLLNTISSGKCKMLCINDTSKTTDFEDKKERVKKAFELLLPESSAFERE